MHRTPRKPQPSRMVLQENEQFHRNKLEEAILATTADVVHDNEDSVLKTTERLKACLSAYEEASRELTKWLRTHGHIAETRNLRRERHKLIYSEGKECIEDLNDMLKSLDLECVSNVGTASVLSENFLPLTSQLPPTLSSSTNVTTQASQFPQATSTRPPEATSTRPPEATSTQAPQATMTYALQFPQVTMTQALNSPQVTATQASVSQVPQATETLSHQLPQATATHAPQIAETTTTQAPTAQFPQAPTAQFPQAPMAQFPQAPMAQFPQAPMAQFPQAPMAQFPQAPMAQFPQAPMAQFPQAPMAQFPQAPTAQFPQTLRAHVPQAPEIQATQLPHAQAGQVPHLPQIPAIPVPNIPNSLCTIDGEYQHLRPHNGVNPSYQFPVHLTQPIRNISRPMFSRGDQSRTTDHQPIMQNLERLDASTRHLVKQDLLRGSSSKFEGNAQQFLSWSNNLRRRLYECEADSMDAIQIILANTESRPKTMVQNFISAGIADPDTTLHDIWENLERRFATPNRIADELIRRLNNIPPIRNSYETHKLEDLMDLCKIIYSNMVNCPELGIYNLSHGMKSVWERLPEGFQSKWRSRFLEHEEQTGISPDFGLFIEFFGRFLRDVSHPSFLHNTKPSYNKSIKTLITANEVLQEKEKPIIFCDFHNSQGHSIAECKAFTRLAYADRKQFVFRNGLCYLCLEKHLAKVCTNRDDLECGRCKQAHVTAMHNDKYGRSIGERTYNSTYDVSPHETDEHKGSFMARNSCTLLCGSESLFKICTKTVPVEIAVSGQSQTMRCLCILDEQSNASFCDPKIASFFNAVPEEIDYILSTLTGKQTLTGSLVSNLFVRGVQEEHWLKLPKLITHPDLPNNRHEVATPRIVSSHPHIKRFSKRFPQILDTDEVLMLLGADAGEFMRTKTHGSHAPFVHQTPIGFALVGPVCCTSSENSGTPVEFTALRTSVIPCEHSTSKFIFSPDSCIQRDILDSPFTIKLDDDLLGDSQEDRKFKQLMEREISVNEKGNLQLPLPLREDVVLSNNQAAVFHRTRNTLDRLTRSTVKLEASLRVMGEYLSAGHVEQVPPGNASLNPYYIPIFPIYNEAKQKTRLVFDSSAKYKGVSLNQALMQGPDLNNSLLGVLLRFRLGEVAVNADIEKMFHAFYVDPKHIDKLRFYWFRNNNPQEDIVPYRALVHIFGNKPSPAIASFALRYTTLSSGIKDVSDVSDFISNHFYVDDALYSTDSVPKAIKILRLATETLSKYNIRLHKIMSSHEEVLQAFPESELADTSPELKISSSEPLNKTLGIVWSPGQDTLSLSPNIPDRPFTKRGILAVTSSVYDPLGLVSPITLRGRLLQRKIIPAKHQLIPDVAACDWDDPLPERYLTEWKLWMDDLKETVNLQMRRCYKPANFGEVLQSEIHCFCDASDEAIGYVMYLRQINRNHDICVGFLFAASKVAPRAAGTIPRLELCAATEASKAATKIMMELNVSISSCQFYTDSEIVLGFINNSTKRFVRYVSRRVDEILNVTDKSQWHHIAGLVNVGDLASRPQSIRTLLDSNWLTGPNFLLEELPIENKPLSLCSVDLPELKSNKTEKKPVIEHDLSIEEFLCSRTNSWYRVRRIFAIVLKFVHLSRLCEKQSEQCATCDLDMDKVTWRFIRFAKSVFAAEKAKLGQFQTLSDKDPLSSLNPFIDDEGILRVGGRLRNSRFPADVRHPILLPSKHVITAMIIEDAHDQVKHQGRYLTLGNLRQNGYHVLKANTVVRKYISDCVICRRLRGQFRGQLMADLPADRLEETPPFTNVGLDVFGPYNVHDGKSTRSHNSTKKAWGLIITCLVSRAVHIELLPYMDTSSMQLALRRFFAVRGTCKIIRSDQGTNLTGTRNQLLDMNQLQIGALKHGIKWELIPPGASSWGGVWERKIGAIKRILEYCLLTAGKSTLSRDELNTYLQECGSIVNNTPLWECSSMPDDPAPISPAHLLTLRDSPNPASPEMFTKDDLSRYGANRWRRIGYLCDEFWRRWRQHYITNLLKRPQWKTINSDVKLGDIVLVRNQNKRNDWPVGRVFKLRRSKDDLVRSVVIKLAAKSGQSRYLERCIRDTILLMPASTDPHS